MPDGQVLEFSGVSKRFGTVTAVDGFTARVEPGAVTGFLGPNGAGKTTTLRILLGLVRATGGTATIGGVPYAKLSRPLQTVGAVLEASSFHPGRTAANHLKVFAQAAGLPISRVDEALGLVGLADLGGRKVGSYSLGMRQRLGLAYALIGDPGVLVLDEPANGLDPEGIKWLRGLLGDLARQGRTVLVSSHLLAEVQQTVDSLLVIAQGRLVFQGTLADLEDPSEYVTIVDSPDRGSLVSALKAGGVEVEVLRSGLTVRGVDPAHVGQVAAASGVALSALQRRGPALEEVFLDLVNGARVHPSAQGTDAVAPVAEITPVAAIAAVEVGEPLVEDEPDVADEPDEREADAAPTTAAGFAVASTGVIDIVQPDDEQEAWAEPVAADPWAPPADAGESEGREPEAAAEPADGEPEWAEPEDAEPEDAEPEWAEPEDQEPADAEPDEVAGEAASVPPSEDEADFADETDEAGLEPPADDDRPWEQYVRTEADEEADRFFAAFTQEAEDEQPGDQAEPASGSEAEAEQHTEAESDPEHHADTDHEGGESR